MIEDFAVTDVVETGFVVEDLIVEPLVVLTFCSQSTVSLLRSRTD